MEVALARAVRPSSRPGLKRESHLQLQPPVVATFGERSEAACQRVGLAEERRSQRPIDRAGIDVIQQIARLHGQCQIIAPIGRATTSAAETARTTADAAYAAHPAWPTARSASAASTPTTTAAAIDRTFASGSEAERLG